MKFKLPFFKKKEKTEATPQYRSFESARQLAGTLNLFNLGPGYYFQWAKSENCPSDMPLHPHEVYKKEWRGWEDFLYGDPNKYINNSYRR